MSRRDTRAYQAWRAMKYRCDNSNAKNYSNYGGRGITYDIRWSYFNLFLADMGECPPNFVLDRKDNNGNYTKENCRWTTRTINNRNSRQTLLNERKVRLIKALIRSVRSGVTQNKYCAIIGPIFGVSADAIRGIDNMRTWTNVK